MTHTRTALYAGTGAAVAALAATALLSRLEGHSALRAINSTSHIIWGPDDAPSDEIDVERTVPGLLINIGSAYFWGTVFACMTPRPERRSTGDIVGRAFGTSLLAGVIDYGLVPRRLRPGWELAMRPGFVAAAIAAMGAGIAWGGLKAREAERFPWNG